MVIQTSKKANGCTSLIGESIGFKNPWFRLVVLEAIVSQLPKK